MSDRYRKRIGILFVIISMILSVVPFVLNKNSSRISFRAGNSDAVPIKPLKNDHAGEIEINTADAEELTRLPGIGDTISSLIIAERIQNGPFYYVEDLVAVRGIGPVLVSKIQKMINLAVNESGE